MFKLLFLSVALVFTTVASATCAPQLVRYVSTIRQLPEARALISSLQQEGEINFAVSNHPLAKQFGAFWDINYRTVHVNLDFHSSEGTIIGSIIFELHNAGIGKKWDLIDAMALQGKMNQEQYVEAVEYLEYVNSVNASQLVEKGIAQGIYPEAARLHTYRDFKEHYHYQKIGGHTKWIAKTYSELMM